MERGETCRDVAPRREDHKVLLEEIYKDKVQGCAE